MSEYRFHLQKYKMGNRYSCPQCGRKRCFARYIDEEGQIVFPDNVGRCDHEQSCGYHYSPSDYFKDNPDANCNDDWRYKTPIKECCKEKTLDTFLAFVDHMSCSADTYVSLGGSNGCADQLTNWDGTQKKAWKQVQRREDLGIQFNDVRIINSRCLSNTVFI